MQGNPEHVTAETTVAEVVARPEFGEWGRMLFPVSRGFEVSGSTQLKNLTLTWYNNLDAAKTVEIVNRLLDDVTAGRQVFYDIYTEAEKAADPSLRDTGLIYFRPEGVAAGQKVPFGMWSAGGGMVYVGAMHDSFPQALELAKHGYAGFAVIYRPGWNTAMADLARAIQFVFERADELCVDTSGYLLGGGSAGARMAANLGSWGPAAYGAADLPKPSAVVMQYTGHSDYNASGEPATFVTVGTADGIASWLTMAARVEVLDALGTPTELHVYQGLPHGFGLGTGTEAEGWMEQAIAFWKANSPWASAAAKPAADSTSATKPAMPQTGFTTAVPDAYLQPSAHPGTVEAFAYTTPDRNGSGATVTKTAYVYLPYGYDEGEHYNIVYLMHGWGGHAGEYFELGNIKELLDHLIDAGDVEPTIFVSPTFYTPASGTDFSSSVAAFHRFYEEFAQNLMPAVESAYSTYAETTTPEGLAASRDHRAFGGFSLGSVTTWLQLCENSDYIRYFLPMSGSCWYYGTYGDFQTERNVDLIEQLVQEKRLDERGYFIYFTTGTNDTVKSQSIAQAEAMLARPETFGPEHFVFYQKDGGCHDHYAVREYLYNALPLFFRL